MQVTLVWSLVQEDSTCCGATIERWDGVGDGREVHLRGPYIPVADSCWCMANTSTNLSSNNFFKGVYILISLVAQMVKHLPIMWETRVQSLGWEDLLGKEMATHFSILACKIPWMEEPGRLQSMVSQSQTLLSDFTFFHFNCLLWIRMILLLLSSNLLLTLCVDDFLPFWCACFYQWDFPFCHLLVSDCGLFFLT